MNNSDRMGKVSNDDRSDWREAWALFPGEVAYVWHGALHAGIVAESLEACGFQIRSQIVWAKPSLEFKKSYLEARRASFGQSIARMQQASSAAVSTLLKIMIDGSAPPSTRVRAADSVLNHSLKAMEMEDISTRLEELERSAESQSGQGRRSR